MLSTVTVSGFPSKGFPAELEARSRLTKIAAFVGGRNMRLWLYLDKVEALYAFYELRALKNKREV